MSRKQIVYIIRMQCDMCLFDLEEHCNVTAGFLKNNPLHGMEHISLIWSERLGALKLKVKVFFPFWVKRMKIFGNLWEDVPSFLHDSIAVSKELGAFPQPILTPLAAVSMPFCRSYPQDKMKPKLAIFSPFPDSGLVQRWSGMMVVWRSACCANWRTGVWLSRSQITKAQSAH